MILPRTRTQVIVVPLFWSVYGKCTEGIYIYKCLHVVSCSGPPNTSGVRVQCQLWCLLDEEDTHSTQKEGCCWHICRSSTFGRCESTCVLSYLLMYFVCTYISTLNIYVPLSICTYVRTYIQSHFCNDSIRMYICTLRCSPNLYLL